MDIRKYLKGYKKIFTNEMIYKIETRRKITLILKKFMKCFTTEKSVNIKVLIYHEKHLFKRHCGKSIQECTMTSCMTRTS